jgi:hypothetical protein
MTCSDSDDDRMEDEIDSNLDALHGAAGRLKNLGLAMGREVDEQNKHIERIIGKTDKVDDQIAMVRTTPLFQLNVKSRLTCVPRTVQDWTASNKRHFSFFFFFFCRVLESAVCTVVHGVFLLPH